MGEHCTLELIFIYTSIIFSVPLTHLINWACFEIGNVGKNTDLLMGRILLMDNKQNQFLFAYSIRFWFAYKSIKWQNFHTVDGSCAIIHAYMHPLILTRAKISQKYSLCQAFIAQKHCPCCCSQPSLFVQRMTALSHGFLPRLPNSPCSLLVFFSLGKVVV